jgi:hypothetical protein
MSKLKGYEIMIRKKWIDRRKCFVNGLMLMALMLAGPCLADLEKAKADGKGDVKYELVIRDHRFEPEVLEIPAGRKVKILIRNLDDTPEEFESYELRREKIIMGKKEAVIYVGPLKAGDYPFFGEFHKDTAQGKIRAQSTTSAVGK